MFTKNDIRQSILQSALCKPYGSLKAVLNALPPKESCKIFVNNKQQWSGIIMKVRIALSIYNGNLTVTNIKFKNNAYYIYCVKKKEFVKQKYRVMVEEDQDFCELDNTKILTNPQF